ncbi:uncharacterized protein LOC103569483 [Microplitis demolitor]|uniref:uncharacterized protein LOC103569483 n=1 Tax=Microplitis demolitor TaxID=69319 RepID=UPI0004CCB63E|nr:uncharacterized protein LOC103569483 [Microplitis demolitor]
MKMFNFVILCLCIYGATCSPTVLYSKPTVNADEAGESAVSDVGIITDKMSDSERELSTRIEVPGANNTAEKIQVYPQYLPGTENLAEKAIPEAVIRQIGYPSYRQQ